MPDEETVLVDPVKPSARQSEVQLKIQFIDNVDTDLRSGRLNSGPKHVIGFKTGLPLESGNINNTVVDGQTTRV